MYGPHAGVTTHVNFSDYVFSRDFIVVCSRIEISVAPNKIYLLSQTNYFTFFYFLNLTF